MPGDPYGDWLAVNRANWNERVAIHAAASSMYDLAPLRAGHGRLQAIEEAELGAVQGQRVLHLQCHFGADTLTLAQRGARIVGVDFSPDAIAYADALCGELGLRDSARFVLADVYATPDALPEPASFDLVYVTWGALYWLPDIRRWATVVAHFLKPGGRLYLAEGHPAALVFDDMAGDGKLPGWFASYFEREPLIIDDESDYADASARLVNKRTYSWMHTLSDLVGALMAAGLDLAWLREHPRVPWPMFKCLVQDADAMFAWPDKAWLPLAFSLEARRR